MFTNKMMARNLFVLVACTAFTCVSCGKFSSSSGDRIGKQLYTMQELSHKVFALDDSTTQELSYIHTFVEGDSLLLASYNEPMHNSCIFDVASGKEIRKVQFRLEGPDALGNNVFGFLYHNKDSIFVYHTWTWQLDLFNGKGQILNRYKLLEVPVEQGCPYVMPEILPQTYAPIRKVGDNIIMHGQGGRLPDPNPDKLQQGVTAIFNLEDSTIYFDNPTLQSTMQARCGKCFITNCPLMT